MKPSQIVKNLMDCQKLTQICRSCNIEKPLKKFRKDSRGSLGRSRVCKLCTGEEVSDSEKIKINRECIKDNCRRNGIIINDEKQYLELHPELILVPNTLIQKLKKKLEI